MTIPPDTKDWTWVLHRRCAECGFDPTTVERSDLAARTLAALPLWRRVLARPDAPRRRSPERWSDLEYGCHVRDVLRLFEQRVRLMLEQDDPLFANWDQDATAVADRYAEQDPATVAAELEAAGRSLAARFAAVPEPDWERPGRRSNGSVFTVASLGTYFLHDLEHHGHDVDNR